MPCIKCGQTLEDGQLFCPACLDGMAEYPIKPGTPIQLPPQQPPQPAKPRRKKKRELKPEEEIHRLRDTVRWLTVILVVLFIAFGLLSAVVLVLLEQRDLPIPL